MTKGLNSNIYVGPFNTIYEHVSVFYLVNKTRTKWGFYISEQNCACPFMYFVIKINFHVIHTKFTSGTGFTQLASDQNKQCDFDTRLY